MVWYRLYKLQKLNMNVTGERLREQQNNLRELKRLKTILYVTFGGTLNPHKYKHLSMLQKIAKSDKHYNRYVKLYS